MQIIGERFQPFSVFCRWEFFRIDDEASEFVDDLMWRCRFILLQSLHAYQPASITMYSQPYFFRFSAMKSALALTSSSVTEVPKHIQLFQPIGGRSANIAVDSGWLVLLTLVQLEQSRSMSSPIAIEVLMFMIFSYRG